MGLALVHADAVIANGASLSGVVDLTERCIVGIALPAAWTAASITLASSPTPDGTFLPVYDSAGVEITITAAAAHWIVVAPDVTRGLRYVKLRSGTSGAPVVQLAERILTCALVNDIAS